MLQCDVRTSKHSHKRKEDRRAIARAPPHRDMAGSNPCRAREPSKAKSSRGCDRFQEDLNAGRFFQDFVPLVFVAGVAFDGHIGIIVVCVVRVFAVGLCKFSGKGPNRGLYTRSIKIQKWRYFKHNKAWGSSPDQHQVCLLQRHTAL